MCFYLTTSILVSTTRFSILSVFWIVAKFTWQLQTMILKQFLKKPPTHPNTKSICNVLSTMRLVDILIFFFRFLFSFFSLYLCQLGMCRNFLFNSFEWNKILQDPSGVKIKWFSFLISFFHFQHVFFYILSITLIHLESLLFESNSKSFCNLRPLKNKSS